MWLHDLPLAWAALWKASGRLVWHSPDGLTVRLARLGDQFSAEWNNAVLCGVRSLHVTQNDYFFLKAFSYFWDLAPQTSPTFWVPLGNKFCKPFEQAGSELCAILQKPRQVAPLHTTIFMPTVWFLGKICLLQDRLRHILLLVFYGNSFMIDFNCVFWVCFLFCF